MTHVHYWSNYTSHNHIPDPQTRRKAYGQPLTTRIHNEMDQPNPDKPKKCYYYGTESHHRANVHIGND